jgi:hypothetical protein
VLGLGLIRMSLYCDFAWRDRGLGGLQGGTRFRVDRDSLLLDMILLGNVGV